MAHRPRPIADATWTDSTRETLGWRSVLSNRWLRRILLIGIGIGLGVAQQLTGIDSVMYDGQTILSEAGFSRDSALIANIALGVIAVVGAFIALRMKDTFSRRTFVIGYALTFLNVATWVTLSEILPLKMRAFGMGASVFVLWIANAFLGLYFPTLVSAIGITGCFFAFAVVNLLALVFVQTQVPETRGRTLEELEEAVTSGAIHTREVREGR